MRGFFVGLAGLCALAGMWLLLLIALENIVWAVVAAVLILPIVAVARAGYLR